MCASPYVGGVDQGKIRPRHMVCMDKGKNPETCGRCMHRCVHDETVDCRSSCLTDGVRCEPVAEANR